MDGVQTFDRLVAELSLPERRDLFSKLRNQVVISTAPLFLPEAIADHVMAERRFAEAPWFIRLFYRFVAIFKSRTALELYEEHLVDKLAASVEGRSPGLYDHRRNLLLAAFRDELQSLKQSARFFYEALDGSVVRDKGAFFAFLASMEMDFIHRRLVTECDPEIYFAANSTASEQDIRQGISRALESILDTIDEDQRRVMYRNVRSLLCLKELASFLFDRAISAFSTGAREVPSCPAYVLQDQLIQLNDVLFSLDFPPSTTLLEALFLFDLQDRMSAEGFNLEEETRKLLVLAEESLNRIRNFHTRIPLTALLRCTSRNLQYEPQIISGGEDWFAVYRDFWRKQVDERYAAFIKSRRKEQLGEGLKSFLKGKGPISLENAHAMEANYGVPFRHSFTMAFWAGFHKYVFIDDINRALKPILLDGEFYKRENRSEFTESYNDLLKLGDALRAFDEKLSPEGEIGRRYELVRHEVVALPIKRRKLLSLAQEVESEAGAIVERSSASLRTLAAILNGILNGQAGGRYDSLANLNALSGKTGAFISLLRNALQKCDKALQLLGEIDALETGR